VLILAIKNKSYIWYGGSPPTQEFTTAEELALDLNKGKPVIPTGLPDLRTLVHA